jgi:hypothetical protein
MSRARAEELAAAATHDRDARPVRRSRPVSRWRLFLAMPKDVRALVVGSVLVMVVGLGWLVFGPRQPSSIPALLGRVDPGPPPVTRPTPLPRPPLKLPWWK